MKYNASLVKSLPALLTLTGGLCLGAGKAQAAWQPLESRISKISGSIATQPADINSGAVQGIAQSPDTLCVSWPNWHNGGWRNWHNWHNWHNW